MSLVTAEQVDERLLALEAETLQARAQHLACTWDGTGLLIPFFGCHYRVVPGEIQTLRGLPANLTISGILSDYVSSAAPPPTPARHRVGFRELPGAGPLTAAFASNTHKIIAQTFGADTRRLQAGCRRLEGRIDADATGFDLVVDFKALPRVPLYLQFNAADDDFPAEATLHFDAGAEAYLSLHSLFALATYLTGRLIAKT